MKAISCRCVYKLKRDANDNIDRYKACFVVKGYAKKLDIDLSNF